MSLDQLFFHAQTQLAISSDPEVRFQTAQRLPAIRKDLLEYLMKDRDYAVQKEAESRILRKKPPLGRQNAWRLMHRYMAGV